VEGSTRDCAAEEVGLAVLLGRVCADRRLEGDVSDVSWDDLAAFLHSRFPRDPEVANETWKRVRIRVAEGLQIEVSVEAYSMGVARLVMKEFNRAKRSMSYSISAEVCAREEVYEFRPRRLADLGKGILTTSERELLRQYFHDAKNQVVHRERLAARLGISMETLYKRVSRLRERLQSAHRNESGSRQA
jgi:hypothetical protein